VAKDIVHATCCGFNKLRIRVARNVNEQHYHDRGLIRVGWNSAGNLHVGRSDIGPQVTHVLGIIDNLCEASGNTLYWVLWLVWCGASGNTLYWALLLVYVGPRVTHFTGYCCWPMCLRQHFTGYCCWFMWGLGQHTLLGIVVGYVVLRQHTLLAIVVGYVVPRTTHLTGYCCGLYEVLGSTLYWASLALMWGAFISGFKINLFLSNSRKVVVSVSVVSVSVVSVSVSAPKLLKRISPHKQNHMVMVLHSCFPINLFKRATIRQISYSQTCTFPQTVRRKPSGGRVYYIPGSQKMSQ
jgi:hypothetical protein